MVKLAYFLQEHYNCLLDVVKPVTLRDEKSFMSEKVMEETGAKSEVQSYDYDMQD